MKKESKVNSLQCRVCKKKGEDLRFGVCWGCANKAEKKAKSKKKK